MMNHYFLTNIFPRDTFFMYDYDENPVDRFELEEGIFYSNQLPIHYSVDFFTDDESMEYDLLSTVGPPLISQKLKNLIEKIADCQILAAVIHSERDNKQYSNFYVLNILSMVECVDWDRSKTRKVLKTPDSPEDFRALFLKEENLQDIHLCRVQEHPFAIVVSEFFVELCKQEKIKGVGFRLQGDIFSCKLLEWE